MGRISRGLERGLSSNYPCNIRHLLQDNSDNLDANYTEISKKYDTTYLTLVIRPYMNLSFKFNSFLTAVKFSAYKVIKK